MSVRIVAAVFAALALTLGGCSTISSLQADPPPHPVAPPAPAAPPVVPDPPQAPAQQRPSGGIDAGESEEFSVPYDNCHWVDDATGWHCRTDVESGYVDVPDDDPGIGPCAGLTYYECTGQSNGSESTSEPDLGDTSDTTSGCASPDVYDPYQCPGDSPLDDGHADSDEIERSCQFHGATDPEALEQCTANY